MKQESGFLKYLAAGRIQALADGIFAIAMTLLVLSIQLPELRTPLDNARLVELLRDLLPRFYTFALSFILLASFWRMHHRQYHWIARIDNGLLWINMFWFLAVVLVPFSSSLVGGSGSLVAAALFFHFNLCAIGCISFLSWIYACRRELGERPLEKSERRYETALNGILPAVALLAALACLLSPSWSSMAYFLILPIKLIVKRLFLKRNTAA